LKYAKLNDMPTLLRFNFEFIKEDFNKLDIDEFSPLVIYKYRFTPFKIKM